MLKLSRGDLLQRKQGKRVRRGGLLDDMAKLYKRQTQGSRNREIIIKTEKQIDGIRKSCHLTRDILDAITPRIVPGITTEQINTWVHEMTLAHGATPASLNYRGFPKSVCTTINEQICHGIPSSERVLHAGDIINIDVTSILDGYYGDSSRMFLVGDVSDEARKLVEVTRACLYLGIEQVKPDNTLGDIGHAIQQQAESHGYSVVRSFVGHGTGVKFHEPPDVLHYGKPGYGIRLLPNMVFTIEPMINIGTYDVKVLEDGWTAVTADGSLSAQWEHTVRVTEDEVEILTE